MTELIFDILKQEEEHPVPSLWRPIFSSIVMSFIKKDYALSSGIKGVLPISNETACHIKEYISDYAEDLVELPNETWEYSVCAWMGEHWEVLIDLWTFNEGHSDLVLSAKVIQNDRDYFIDIHMVYVP